MIIDLSRLSSISSISSPSKRISPLEEMQNANYKGISPPAEMQNANYKRISPPEENKMQITKAFLRSRNIF